MNPQKRLNSLRGQVIFRLKKSWPKRATPVTWNLPFCTFVNALLPAGGENGMAITCSTPLGTAIRPVEAMATDDIVKLLELMDRRKKELLAACRDLPSTPTSQVGLAQAAKRKDRR